uniref:F-box domain-containing protein n=1 Tax=Oryza punctata TaxID=4537 RepID=A0A0E0KZ39_ORYPU
MAEEEEDDSRERIPSTAAAEIITDDLLVEILSRVPYQSLCRSKCVSRRWRRVISHPNHRRLLPRYHLDTAIAGFFHLDSFTNVTGEGRRPLVDALLPFLPKCEYLNVVDSCNGLLLCRCWRLTDPRRFDYLVVNPATEHWVILPDSGWSDKMQNARLGFDPAASSSHFHVFEFVEDGAGDVYGNVDGEDYDNGHVKGVEIYSSITGEWSHKENGWGYDEIRILGESNSVFLDSVLHLITLEYVVAAVDVEGNTWRTIPMPQSLAEPFNGIAEGFIGLSRGSLYFVNTDHDEPYKVSVWVLEDYSSEQWIWKHTVSHLHLFRTKKLLFGMDYKVVSVHPERDIIFLVLPHSKILMSYELDSREAQFICGIGGSSEWLLYLPYVPFYSESLAGGL